MKGDEGRRTFSFQFQVRCPPDRDATRRLIFVCSYVQVASNVIVTESKDTVSMYQQMSMPFVMKTLKIPLNMMEAQVLKPQL